MSSSLPVRLIPRIFHVGTMDPAHRGRQYSTSMEGDCLSVSECPTAWIKIAKLGGNPVHELSKPDGCFLDVHAVKDDVARLEEIITWAISEGWVEKTQQWRAWLTDEEGEWYYILCGSEQQALEEREEFDAEEAPEGVPGVEAVTVISGTPLLAERLKHSAQQLASEDCTDFAILMWARHHTAVDGLLWDEEYDPVRLSAPRAGIFPERLAEWAVKPMAKPSARLVEELTP